MSKNKSEVIISFADDYANEQVTGSCVLVNKNILLECGGSQGGNMLENYKKNNANFKFKTKELDYVFIMHSHIDHCMRVPLIFKRNGRPKVFIPSGSREIMLLSLLNCAMILENEAKILTKRSKSNKEYEPIFTKDDVETMFDYVYEVDMHINRKLSNDVNFKFISSGHVPFGASLELNVNNKKILYTSDLGNAQYKSYYCEPLESIKSCDLVISECTYSDKNRSSNNINQREKDIQRLESAISHFNKVLIPSFAFHRAQSIATMLYDMYKDGGLEHNIYMDSILLNDISKVFSKKFQDFKKVMSWDKIKVITKNERSSLMNSNEKMIIISASGSLVAGASVQWATNFLNKKDACFVFIGHQFENSLGYKLKLNNQKYITIQGEKIKNNASVVKMKSMSSHIQHDNLIDYLSEINTPKIALHHSNYSDKLKFKKELENHFESICKTTRVICPSKSTKIKL